MLPEELLDNIRVGFHWGMEEQLRELLSGGMPDSSVPLDGQLYLPIAPIPPDRLVGQRSGGGEYFGRVLAEYRKAEAEGKTCVNVQMYPTDHHFFTDDLTLIEQAQAIWDSQNEIVAHDLHFIIEAVWQFTGPGQQPNTKLYVEKLFDDSGLPAGWRQMDMTDGNSACLVVRVPGSEPPSHETLAAVNRDMRSTLAALCFRTARGFRVRRFGVQPVRRRVLDFGFGTVETRVPPTDFGAVNGPRERYLADPRAEVAMRGLSSALSTFDQHDAMVALWGAVEVLYDPPPRGENLLSAAEKRAVKTSLNKCLPHEKSTRLYEEACKFKAASRRDRIAAELHRVVPEVAEVEWHRRIGEVERQRANATHRNTREGDVSEPMDWLIEAIVKYLGRECGLPDGGSET